MRTIFRLCLGLLAALVAGLAGVLTFGTGTPAPAMASISEPFRSVDFSAMPTLRQYDAPRGSPVSYRRYGPDAVKHAVILLHGSTASSASMHPLAQHLASAGMAVYAPDIRGHGATGTRGDIDRDGQLHDDLDMLVSIVRTNHPEAFLTVTGFSAGGGLALRYAGSAEGYNASRYVLIAPALGRGAPTTRNTGDAWATPHVPRITAISLLNRIGIGWFNGMEAIRFAVPPGSEKVQVGAYSYRMLTNLLPTNYADDLKNIVRPTMAVMAEKDELFDQPTLRRALMEHRPDISVTIVPELNHIGLILDPNGQEAIARTIRGEGLEIRPDEGDPDGVQAHPITPPNAG